MDTNVIQIIILFILFGIDVLLTKLIELKTEEEEENKNNDFIWKLEEYLKGK